MKQLQRKQWLRWKENLGGLVGAHKPTKEEGSSGRVACGRRKRVLMLWPHPSSCCLLRWPGLHTVQRPMHLESAAETCPPAGQLWKHLQGSGPSWADTGMTLTFSPGEWPKPNWDIGHGH